MPVLWQPLVQTSLASLDPEVPAFFTLNLLTTQWIDKGILLRFQMWNGADTTYYGAIGDSTLVEWDLIVREAIPPGTTLVVAMRETGTAIWGFTGRKTYATGGAGIPAALFGANNSCLCFAFAPTTSGAWTPARGRPMFAIGFNHPSPPQMGSNSDGDECGTVPTPGTGQPTAPNFPDQWSDVPDPWTFVYEVVYPYIQPLTIGADRFCAPVLGIKFEAPIPVYPTGSWSNARDSIAQPWTIIKDNYLSVNNWQYYSVAETAVFSVLSPAVGPFVFAAMPGQLVPVYWQPRYKDINTDTTPQDGTPLATNFARLGLLVTSPLQPNMSIYFTNDEFDASNGGFGPRRATTGVAPFINTNPAFTWVTGSSVIPAGTVVLIDQIGADVGPITVQDAHDSAADVGAIIGNRINGEAVPSLMALGVWLAWGAGGARPIAAGMFTCAALSDQYAGDFPPLSPCLTIHKDRFVGQVIYGMNRVFDNKNLFGTVQAPLVNCANFTQLTIDTAVAATELPTFLNMSNFAW